MLFANALFTIVLFVTSFASADAADGSPLRGGQLSSDEDNNIMMWQFESEETDEFVDFEIEGEFDAFANVTERQLSGDYWYPRKWGKACRHHDPDYKTYYKYSFSDCKHACRNKDWCKAFEHNDDSKRCELWKVVPTYFQSKHDFSCYIKSKHYDDSDDDDWRDDYYKHSNKACRTRRNKEGTKGHDFYRWKGKSLYWCQDKCKDYGSKCKGFEYKHYDGKHCEVWFTYPKKTQYKKGYSCYKKK